jgi:hypothetical protein
MKSRLKTRLQVRIFIDGSLPLGPGKAAMTQQAHDWIESLLTAQPTPFSRCGEVRTCSAFCA